MMIPSWALDDSPIDDPFGYGEDAVAWLRRLKHPKNPEPGHPFQLDRWQERVIRKIYGPRHLEDKFDKDGLREARRGDRIVRRVCLLLPRGNRKTSLAAAITLLQTLGPEAKEGDVVLSAASSYEQAMELYREAKLIVDYDPRMRKHLTPVPSQGVIKCDELSTVYKALAADGGKHHGKTPRVVIADELHVWKGIAGRDMWGALSSALVKTPDTLMIIATTAGRGQDNLAWKEVAHAIKVQKGEIEDAGLLPVIFMAEEGDNWEDPDLWKTVNPGMRLGYPDLPGFLDSVSKARSSPSDLDDFKQFNLNMWADKSSSPFVSMAVYDEGAGEVDLAELRGRPCWLGVDLSSHTDLTVIVAAWQDDDGGFTVHPWFFCPQGNLRERQDKSEAPYIKWAADGLITPTEGDYVDHRAVEAKIRDICDDFDVQEIAFDPALAGVMMSNLQEDGLPAMPMRQGALSMMPAIAAMELAVLRRQLRHGGHPVLRFCVANAEVETNSHGHKVRLGKSKKWLSIDGAVATCMAIMRASLGDSAGSGSVYDNENWRESLAAFGGD